MNHMNYKAQNGTAAKGQDLGPLAWVLTEMRESYGNAIAILQTFFEQLQDPNQTDVLSDEASKLHQAKTLIHQACGALEMVGAFVPAFVLRQSENTVARMITRPDLCNEKSIASLAKVGLAVGEYLENLLQDPSLSPVLLFPAYREVQALSGAAAPASPADLWHLEGELHEPKVQMPSKAIAPSNRVRQLLDHAILQIMQGVRTHQSGSDLVKLCLGLAAHNPDFRERTFWKVAAGFFEAISLELVPVDVYVKRAATRVLVQYASLIKGDTHITARWMQDLLFFCSQAGEAESEKAPVLSAVREAFGLANHSPTDYKNNVFSLLTQTEKTLLLEQTKAITDSWGHIVEGELEYLPQLNTALKGFADTINKYFPDVAGVTGMLQHIHDALAQKQVKPSSELSMEVATTILYLQATLADIRIRTTQLPQRMRELTERLRIAAGEGKSQPLPAWMEELYTRVSDGETIGSVVGELRASLSEAENHIDQFFRNPTNAAPLQNVPAILAKARGVLAVLGLTPATKAIQKINQDLLQLGEELAQPEVTPPTINDPRFEQIGANLGALSLQVDMLAYQPTLAKELFLFDQDKQLLQPLMGRLKVYEIGGRDIFEHVQESEWDPKNLEVDERYSDSAESNTKTRPALEVAQTTPSPTAETNPNTITASELAKETIAVSAPVVAPASATDDDEGDDELLEIFLEEATEVITQGREALQALQSSTQDVAQQTTLRRAFHTLKGSSRMVGLNSFGEAAWALEQLMNSWLAEQRSFTSDMQTLCTQALDAMEQWVGDIAARRSTEHWQPKSFQNSSEAMRNQQRLIPLGTPAINVISIDAPAKVQEDEIAAAIPIQANITIEPPLQSFAPDVTSSINFDALDLDFADSDFEPIKLRTDSHEDTDPERKVEARTLLQSDEFDIDATIAAPLNWDNEVPAVKLDDDDRTLVASLEAFEAAEREAFEASSKATEIMTPLPLTDADQSGLAESNKKASIPALTLGDDMSLLDDLDAQFASTPSSAKDTSKVDEFKMWEAASNAEKNIRTASPPADLDLLGHIEIETATVTEALSGDASLLADLDALAALTPTKTPVEPKTDAPQTRENLTDSTQTKPTHIAEQAAPIHAPSSKEALEEGLESDSMRWHLLALQLAQEIEAGITQWTLNPAPRLPETLSITSNELADAAQQIPSALSFKTFLQEIASTITQLTTKAPASKTEVEATLQEALQEVLSALDGLVAGTGRGQIADAWSERLAQLYVTKAVSIETPQTSVIDSASPVAEVGEYPSHALSEDATSVDADLFPIFEEEAIDLLPRLITSLRRWSGDPQSFEARSEALRVLHTLKGSSRLAGAKSIGELVHDFESEIERIDASKATSDLISPLLERYDTLQQKFDALRRDVMLLDGDFPQPPAEQVAFTSPIAHFEESLRALDIPAATLESIDETVSTESAETAIASVEELIVESEPETLSPAPQISNSLTPIASAPPAPIAPLMGQELAGEIPGPSLLNIQQNYKRAQTVRIRSSQINRLINQAGEIQISRNRTEARLRQLTTAIEGMTVDVSRLRQQLRELEVQTESQMQSRIALGRESADFDPLELDRFTRVQELTRMMAETVNDVATVQRTLQVAMIGTEDDLREQERKGRELQRDLLSTRMVEFDSVAERLHAVVRQASGETGKRVTLQITNGAIEMDRLLLDRMMGGFEHLLRNCVDHGIEAPMKRQVKGKSPIGQISIEIKQEGNDVAITFSDDGAGLDLDAIRRKGIEKGLVRDDQTLSQQELSDLVFMPGFTTAQEVTGLSGRGIGMDVLRVDVHALGGRIETTTEKDKGTSFRLVMPLTTAVTQVLLVRAGHITVGIPANLVDGLEKLSRQMLSEAAIDNKLYLDNKIYPFYWAGALMQDSAAPEDTSTKTSPVILVRSAAQVIALQVDEVLGNQEVVVKNLGPQLSALPGLAGMSVLPSGAVLLVYNFIALASVYGEEVQALQHEAALALAKGAPKASVRLAGSVANRVEAPLVLIVDDSITVRRVTQRMLKREGFRVSLAANGVQALEKLAEECPDVMLSDIEMPQMDGFELLKKVRESQEYQDLPTIMITSRTAQKHRDHAISLGANHYLGKPYSDTELLSLIRQHISVD